jgi:hypothetical protein
MIYECRLNRFRRHHLYAALLIIVGLYLLSYFEVGNAAHWWAYSIGIAIAVGAAYLFGNTRVRIEINGEAVTVEHSGMVHANFTLDSVASVAVNGSGRLARIEVETNDGLRFYIPCECFTETKIEELTKVLRKV